MVPYFDVKRHDSARRVIANGRDLQSLDDALKDLKPIFDTIRKTVRNHGHFVGPSESRRA